MKRETAFSCDVGEHGRVWKGLRVRIVWLLMTSVLLSGCATLSALRYSPLMKDGKQITAVTGQVVEMEASVCALPESIAPIPAAILPVLGGTAVELLGSELASRVAKLEQGARRGYSKTLFLDKDEVQALLRDRCLVVKRIDEKTGDQSSFLMLKPIKRGKSKAAMTFELIDWSLANTVSDTQARDGKPVVDLVVSVAIKGIRVEKGTGAVATLSEGTLTKKRVSIPDSGSCTAGSGECAGTDLMPVPESGIDFVSVSVGVVERGTFSDLDLAKTEIEALAKALGGALGAGLKADIAGHNEKK